MIAAAAVDIRGGRCVQLVGGSPSDERISLPDPVAVAMRWFQLGFTTLHVVDLDAALGSGGNLDLVLEVDGAVENWATVSLRTEGPEEIVALMLF